MAGKRIAVTDEELRQARADGLPDEQIAKKFGISASTIVAHIGKRSPEEILAMRRASAERLREKNAANGYKGRAKVPKEDMLKLRAEGWSNPEIAELVGVSGRTVLTHIGPTPAEITGKRLSDKLKKHHKKKEEPDKPEPVVEPKVIALPVTKEERKIEEKCDKTPQKPDKNVIIPQKSEAPKKWPPTIPTRIFDFAYIPSWSSTLAEIAEKANPEPWCFLDPVVDSYNPDYQILETHLTRTFTEYAYRYNTTTAEESGEHFLIRSKFAVMHTGLYTPDLRDIYLYFVPNPVPHVKLKWSLAGVDVDTTNHLCKIHPLPKNTIYSQIRTMVFHPDREVRVATEHIFGQEATAARIPESIRSAWNAALLLETAVDYSRREAVSNKTLAIPCYKAGVGYFLLPLWLSNRDKPDVYALLEDNGEYYVCGTVLTKEQAYFDARLCGKVTQKWLRDLVEE